MTLEELEMISELCRKHDVIVVSDEVYEWLVYPPNQHVRIGQLLGRFSVRNFISASNVASQKKEHKETRVFKKVSKVLACNDILN